MKNTTHFKIENKRELELLYQDFKDDLPINWKEMLERFNAGTRTFQKNSIGLIDFNDDVLKQSTEIKNPYAEEKISLSLKGFEKMKEKKANQENDPRRKRIDDILKILQKDINPEDVTLLLKIFDLEFHQNENVTLNEIYALDE